MMYETKFGVIKLEAKVVVFQKIFGSCCYFEGGFFCLEEPSNYPMVATTHGESNTYYYRLEAFFEKEKRIFNTIDLYFL